MNIGIGGFDFGFVMVMIVLKFYVDGLCMYFILNVDGVDLVDMFDGLDLVMILVLVVFKIFMM